MSERKRINLSLSAEHPQLLAGLDQLLQLGLISHDWVLLLGRSQLSCPIPDEAERKIPAKQKKDSQERIPVIVGALAAAQRFQRTLPRQAKTPNILERFFEELSVRWLLFLGVFLVVLSSGVLVASQWGNFPPLGQYLVLWSYTVLFGCTGLWANRQVALNLTARTLQIIAMLLVPLNFWAVDQLAIWTSSWAGWVAIALIIPLLGGVDYFTKAHAWSKPMVAGFIALGLCHWGWESIFPPVGAVYLSIGIILVIFWGLPLAAERTHSPKIPEKTGSEFLLFGLGLLLFRGITVTGIPIGELGLGLGALGWLLTTLERPRAVAQASVKVSPFWEIGGGILLLLGWLVTVGRYDWQVLGVSALGIMWLLQRLRRTWLVTDLVALFVVGLQGGILCRNIIPLGFKTSATAAAVEFSQAYDFPYAIYSVTLLPYLVIWAIAALWFYRRGKVNLALTSERLLLMLGLILVALSLPNPTWRALNLSISAGIWFYFAEYSRPQLRLGYLYLCHGMALLALAGIIGRFSPPGDFLLWGQLCLLALVLEWGFCLWPTTCHRRKTWQRSSWYFGFILAIASLITLLITPSVVSPLWRLLWLVVPGMATLVAWNKRRQWRREGVVLSIVALVGLPVCGLVTYDWEFLIRGSFTESSSWLFLTICWAIAGILMSINVRLLPLSHLASLHLAFGSALILTVAAQWSQAWTWLIVGSLTSALWWGLSHFLQRHRQYLGRLYRNASQQWGLLFAGSVALALANYCAEQWRYFEPVEAHPEILVSSSILALVLFKKYGPKPQEEAFAMGAIALEGIVLEGARLQGSSPTAIAMVHFVLAAIFWQLQPKATALKTLTTWRAYPLIFTSLGWFWRWGYFETYTGLASLVAGILFLVIAQTYPKFSGFLRLLGFSGITLGLYEIVLFQMSRSSGGNLGDALILLAVVGIILALFYRSFYWLLSHQQKTEIYGIPLQEILTAAHLHWLIAASFKLLTLPYFLSTPPNLKILAIAVNLGLALYAFIQAQNSTNRASQSSDWWIYLGAIELTTTGIQARWMWTEIQSLDSVRVLLVSILALFIFQLPWSNLGWREAPWHRLAIAMPALCLTATQDASYLSLISISIVYLRLAQVQQNIRWSYISLIFGNWLIAKTLADFDLNQPLSYGLQIGLSILLIVQLDPSFKSKYQRKHKHYWRLIGSGLICLIALVYYQEFGITPALISLGLIFLALGSQIRAFLYNGTITLMLTGVYQLVILIDRYAFAKWIISLIAGIILISIAANFEKRRIQILSTLHHWLEEFSLWQ
ncbi:hypothetical protein NIES970_09680 [[Synechococcus] sp. NIES-970]|nr:hypothetical protein NIES970_09680 [[Synechococcus] sp. NIES-970]